jgi:hypothetical protein
VVQIQDIEFLLQFWSVEQVGGQLGIIATAFSLDLLDDELGVTFD